MNCTHIILTGALLLVGRTAFSQEETLAAFQQSHPEVLFIEEQDLGQFDPAFLEINRAAILVFQSEIKQADVTAFLSREKALTTVAASPETIHEAESVKQWLGTHPDIKLIPRSVSDQLTTAERDELTQSGALFLKGETVSFHDISHYAH